MALTIQEVSANLARVRKEISQVKRLLGNKLTDTDKLKQLLDECEHLKNELAKEITASKKSTFERDAADYDSESVSMEKSDFVEDTRIQGREQQRPERKKEYRVSHNLTKNQLSELKALKNDSTLVIRSADKGGAIVIQDRNAYEGEIQRQLSNTTFYRQLNHNPTQEFKERIRRKLDSFLESGQITRTEHSFMVSGRVWEQKWLLALLPSTVDSSNMTSSSTNNAILIYPSSPAGGVPLKKSLPISQFSRIRRICSSDVDFQIQADDLEKRFLHRQYKCEWVTQTRTKFENVSQTECLQRTRVKTADSRVSCIVQYSPLGKAFEDIIRKHWHIVESDPTLKCFTSPPRIVYKRPPNLSNMLLDISTSEDGACAQDQTDGLLSLTDCAVPGRPREGTANSKQAHKVGGEDPQTSHTDRSH
ncbi:hypothetical protein ABVT39_003947 [Epinephelus coioides]